MNAFWLLFCFFILSLIALPLLLYPLRQNKLLLIIMLPCLIIALSLAYLRWGSWTDWQKYNRDQANKEKITSVLKTIKGPEELIKRMKDRLAKEPQNPKGWFLLGRLYASQAQWPKAHEAFLKAHQLNPEDELVTVNYLNSQWQLNNQQFNTQIREQLEQLLTKNPNQADALAMTAIDAFTNRNFQKAINYWQQLLKLAPENSEEAKMIRKAIAKAQSSLLKQQ